ncbi:MAG: helix-turn-helix domain-containing protein [Alistipes sp.]|nr:helix-turn-helix domain-containing protein [Alistipes sp.]
MMNKDLRTAADTQPIEAAMERVIAKMLPKNDEYLTRKQCAERLHITLPTLHSYINKGVLVAYKIGRRTLFKSEEVDAALNKKYIIKRGLC